jgi:hypothetical protein
MIAIKVLTVIYIYMAVVLLDFHFMDLSFIIDGRIFSIAHKNGLMYSLYTKPNNFTSKALYTIIIYKYNHKKQG